MKNITRLAIYGTLAPGEINHYQLDAIKGTWSKGVVKGELAKDGWNTVHNCPGIILNPHGDEVSVAIFQSDDLIGHWERLDAFEGDEYRRKITIAFTDAGEVDVAIYEAVIV